MANFFVPQGADPGHYVMSTDAAGSGSQSGFLHPSKLMLNSGGQITIGLWGGLDFQRRLLELRATPSEVINWSEAPTNYPLDRIITIFGRGAGTVTLHACEEYNAAAVWCSIQVEVAPTSMDLEALVRRNTYLAEDLILSSRS